MCIYEIIREPELIRRPYQIQVILIGILFGFAVLFIIHVVPAYATLEIEAYAMRNGNYVDGANIGGIVWNSHFTDLRVTVRNADKDDYTGLDILLMPEVWTYRASIVGDNPGGCSLTTESGATIFTTITKGGTTKVTMHRSGNSIEAVDSVGDIFTALATSGGYRLHCDRFPKLFTVKVLFACVELNQDMVKHIPQPKLDKPGEWGMSASEWSGVKSSFDMLGPKPFVSSVQVSGSYLKDLATFTTNKRIEVQEGN